MMLSVDDALAETLRSAGRLPSEEISIERAAGRILAEAVVAAVDQPPFRASAMDGYAVRHADATPGAVLRVVGEAAAGAPFRGAIANGEAARIFTGGEVPAGADHIVVQEDASAAAGAVTINEAQARPANIREAGIDFRAGALLKKKGERIGAVDLGIIAAANVGAVIVARKPVVAFFDNGDELVEPGAALEPGRIVGSNRFAFAAMIEAWGGTPLYLGRARDERRAIAEKFADAAAADVVVAVGGASVGDHDHMRPAFADAGGTLIFSKIAVKPGKPTWFGRLGGARVLGLPGNPASAIVCAVLFLQPLIAALQGEARGRRFVRAALKGKLSANGARETYHRASIVADAAGRLAATPFANQDSSLLLPLARGNGLVRQSAHAPAQGDGAAVDCLLYGPIAEGE